MSQAQLNGLGTLNNHYLYRDCIALPLSLSAFTVYRIFGMMFKFTNLQRQNNVCGVHDIRTEKRAREERGRTE